MSVRGFPNRLAVRIAAPILISWALAGALLYSFVLSSASEFLENAADENMAWMARAARNAMDSRRDVLIKEGMAASPGYLLSCQIRSKDEIEAFLRQYKVEGLIIEKTPDGPKEILSLSLPMSEWAAHALDAPPDRASAVTVGGLRRYVYGFDYAPWNWRVLLAKPPETYAALRHKALTAYAATGGILLLAAFLVLYSQYVSVNIPIMRIIRSLKIGEAPSYRGTYEFEYLSDAIRTMMTSLEELNQNLERVVGERTRTLEEKAGELSLANRKLMELDDMKSAFLSSISHELRTPLTSIRGFAKLTLRDFDRACRNAPPGADDFAGRFQRMRKNMDIVMSEGERLTRLVNDILDVNEIESGRAVWHEADADPAALVEEAAVQAGTALLERPGLRFVVDAPDHLPLVRCDPERLRQALFNLLDNAAKFTEKGEVRAIVEPAGPDRIRFLVKDQGVGIDPGDLDRIFDRFHQINHEKTLRDKPSGTGLGLTLCRLIVERHGGTITARSAPGQGSQFTIELPLRPGEIATQTPQGDAS